MALKSGALAQDCDQRFRIHAECCSLNLSDGASWGAAQARDQRYTDESFVPDQTYFHTLSIGKYGQNRNQPRVAEIAGAQGVAGFMQHLVSFEPNKFQLGEDKKAIFGW